MKILVVLSRFPYPLEKGDKLRAYYFIKHLSQNNDIYLFALSDKSINKTEIDHVSKYCKKINIHTFNKLQLLFNLLLAPFRRLPFQVSYFYSKSAQKKFNSFFNQINPDKIFCQLIRTSEYAKQNTGTDKILDYMDAFSKGIERRIAVEPWYMLPVLNYEYRKLVAYEADVFNSFAKKLIISEQDKMAIQHPSKGDIQVVPNGVNVEYFNPAANTEKKYDILFVGNLQYPPNIESIEYLVYKIIPLLIQKGIIPKVLIAGASPSKRILSMATENITVKGWVEDIRTCYAESKIMVAPMQISIGLQNKLLEAMAMKVPCVTSGLANNALQATDRKEIMVANTPEQYVECIQRLLSDQVLYTTLKENAYSFILKKYNWEKNIGSII